MYARETVRGNNCMAFEPFRFEIKWSTTFSLKRACCNLFIMVWNWILERKTQQQNRYRRFEDLFGRVYFGWTKKLGTLVWSREGVFRNGPKDEQKHESPRNFPQRPFLFNLWIRTDKCIRLKHEWNSDYITNMWNCSNYQVWEFAMAFWVRKRLEPSRNGAQRSAK